MSEASESNRGSNGTQNHGAEDQGVLAKLPRTRPQRATARRAAARAASGADGPTPSKPLPASAKRGTASAKRGTASAKRAPAAVKRGTASANRGAASANRGAAPSERRTTTSKRRQPRSTAQGNSARGPQPRASRHTTGRPAAAPKQGFESDGDAVGSVQPPGGVELVASAVEIVGELTKAGISRSERLVKDVFSRLPF